MNSNSCCLKFGFIQIAYIDIDNVFKKKLIAINYERNS